MNGASNTYLLDEAIARRRDILEQERQAVLNQVMHWLETEGSHYGIHQAYIFGSLTRPGHFTGTSDVDIAVERINPGNFFMVLSVLASVSGREVDLIELDNCHFAHRIRQRGILWTKIP